MVFFKNARYKYISKLTIKLLEEGFDLLEHLLALRRYHFMELADWADLFIKSLWHHVFFSNITVMLCNYMIHMTLNFLILFLFFTWNHRSGVSQRLIKDFQKFKVSLRCQFRGLHVSEILIRIGYLCTWKNMGLCLFQHLPLVLFTVFYLVTSLFYCFV